MSYGVWRKRGKGWSSIEVDSPWNYQVSSLKWDNESRYKSLKSLCRTLCIDFYSNDNIHILQWTIGQTKKNREIEYLSTDGEHVIYIAFDNAEARKLSLEKLDGSYLKDKLPENQKTIN